MRFIVRADSTARPFELPSYTGESFVVSGVSMPTRIRINGSVRDTNETITFCGEMQKVRHERDHHLLRGDAPVRKPWESHGKHGRK